MKQLKVCWISGGVSSVVAGLLSKDVDMYIYIHIDDQHPDTLRFIKDCEKLLGKEVIILHPEYSSIIDVIKKYRFVNSRYGAKCTQILKKATRHKWEQEHADYDITYVWGYDNTETRRATQLQEAHPEFKHEFPLIEKDITKAQAHGILENAGVKRPIMYDMGYHNNNCVGCVKGGMGYWNKIRVDFPDVFDRMAKLEREIGYTCIKGVFLDELDPERGRHEKEIVPDCTGFCGIDN